MKAWISVIIGIASLHSWYCLQFYIADVCQSSSQKKNVCQSTHSIEIWQSSTVGIGTQVLALLDTCSGLILTCVTIWNVTTKQFELLPETI